MMDRMLALLQAIAPAPADDDIGFGLFGGDTDL
jgi:hypothetical protein